MSDKSQIRTDQHCLSLSSLSVRVCIV